MLNTNVEMRETSSRRKRRNSLDFPPPSTSMIAAEMYFSDSSTTTEDCEFDSSGRRKRHRMPFPPLPKPVVRHSEVYFTETETESEAPRHKRKEPLPKVDQVPRCQKRNERVKQYRAASTTDLNKRNCIDSPSNRNSLDLALTKLAAKKLTAHEQRARLAGKKPMARPRHQRPLSAVYGNVSSTTLPIPFPEHVNLKVPKRANTVPHTEELYKNVM